MSQFMLRQPLSLDVVHLRLAIVDANLHFSRNNISPNIISSPNINCMPPHQPKAKRRPSCIPVPTDAWKLFSTKKVPFLAVPPEIHLKIFSFLHPVDAVCLSVINKYIYTLSPPLHYPLSTGAPDSNSPYPRPSGCRHCLPVLFYPAHCELHFHLRGSQADTIIPPHLEFCSYCQRFTACQAFNVSDAKEYCGQCATSYKKRFIRGRRMIDIRRPGESQERLRMWYNENILEEVEPYDLVRMGDPLLTKVGLASVGL